MAQREGLLRACSVGHRALQANSAGGFLPAEGGMGDAALSRGCCGHPSLDCHWPQVGVQLRPRAGSPPPPGTLPPSFHSSRVPGRETVQEGTPLFPPLPSGLPRLARCFTWPPHTCGPPSPESSPVLGLPAWAELPP